MNRILIIHKNRFDNMPPLLSVKAAFNSIGYSVDVVTSSCIEKKNLFRKEELCYIIKKNKAVPLFGLLVWYVKFVITIRKLLRKKYEIVWVEGGDTVALFGWFLKTKNKLFFQQSELYDIFPLYRFLIKRNIKKFDKVIVPEINRAFILKVWFNLNEIPSVLPNKPNYSEIKKNINQDTLSTIDKIKKFAKGRKIILYQGLIAGDRKFDGIVEFVIKNSDEFCLVLLGKDLGYLKSISYNTYSVCYAGFLLPPNHLEVTKLAWACVMAYDTTSLNKIYCAPNKIWEYALYNKPIISQYLPGISSIFKEYNFGICCDIMHEKSVEKACRKIEHNYLIMQKNSEQFYNSLDYSRCVKQIIQ